ncbi:MAG TPA: TetR/AcrR family transcriptional regulator [Pirellulales bacterium]|jgi:AcrR family transcriptional regulator|nr:TetR/AcrR family transcriptional regulator [Pirellulales bacterium]
MPLKSSTRQDLVEAAIRRFYRDGFRSVGIDQILADVGISKTAFYKHFESKDDLMLAALEKQNVWLQDTFRAMIRQRGGPRPIDQLHASFDVVEQIIESDEFHGCIFVNAAMEFPLQHEPAHVLASRNRRSIEDLLFELAVAAEARHPRQLAEELCLVMEGAYVTRVVTGNKCTIDIARRIAKLAIASNCCAEPASSPV